MEPVESRCARAALAGRLPARYEHGHRHLFDQYAPQVLRRDKTILDVGAGREPTFPPEARPARCTYVGLDLSGASALTTMGRSWSTFEVIPRHNGALYFGLSRHVQAAYLAYEEWAGRNGHDNLASYNLVVASR